MVCHYETVIHESIHTSSIILTLGVIFKYIYVHTNINMYEILPSNKRETLSLKDGEEAYVSRFGGRKAKTEML